MLFNCQDRQYSTARIQVKTPYLCGEVEALCIPEVICDLVVGNVPSARNLDDPDITAMVGAVTTRAQARQEVRHTTPDTPKSNTTVNPF